MSSEIWGGRVKGVVTRFGSLSRAPLSTHRIASVVLLPFKVTDSCSFPFFSAGELNPDELERIVTIIQNPTQFKIPNWFLNRQKDIVDGRYTQLLSNQLDSKVSVFPIFRPYLFGLSLTYGDSDARGFGALEEDPPAQGSPYLLGTQGSWTTHEGSFDSPDPSISITYLCIPSQTTGRRGKTVGVSKKK
jgi:hypothetical protein